MIYLIFSTMFESGALSGKMFLVRIIKSKKFMLILGQVRLSKDKLGPTGLGIKEKKHPSPYFHAS